MKWNNIKAVLLQEFFVTYRAVEVIMDIIFFPLMSIILFGFLSLYLSGSAGKIVGQSVIMGMLLWQVIFIVQYSVSVGSLWNIWSRNLSNMFITPLRARDYIFAQTISGALKATCVFLISATLSIYIFQFNIFQLGFFPLLIFICNLILFAFSVGLIILGIIFRFGTRIQAFAWGLLPMFQPITAAFYPVTILPTPLRDVSYIFPATYIFEAARKILLTNVMDWRLILYALLENLIYVVIAIWFFTMQFKKSKDTGQFARNES